jgi:hypothetical protein
MHGLIDRLAWSPGALMVESSGSSCSDVMLAPSWLPQHQPSE